ncbi:DNA primase [Sporosarcina sp. P16b]|uniref:phage/plasmid primase, P4 family n=1 Tax=Sporosarcina sp. P16b TaxID=2048261 RepID=UPI000C167CA2|nr:phage/plasmid primase, P4 family [Sporosarcina sp. P16b]PIC71145.1 DNA primase [Sporosarcina sp. P16b]
MALVEKEEILLVAAENIPDELKKLPQFVLWRAEWNEQRKQFDKIPYQLNGRRASSTDSSTWGNFEQVLKIYEENNNYEGVGFVLTQQDDFVCVDIDDLQSVDELDPLAEEIVSMSYAETSPSGKGIHVWFRHKLDRERHKNKNAETGYEIYDSSRFLTITGESLNALPINPGGEELNVFLDKVLKREKAQVSTIQQNDNFGRAALSEEEIIKIACKNPATGDRFKSFLFGGWEPQYQSDYSDADLGFLNDLAFWCNCDIQMIDSIYRKSSLMRDKWDRPQNGTTYGNEQIMKAVSECANTFSPPQGGEGEIKRPWWRTNDNSTRSFLHQVLAKEVMKEYSIVRYPSPHSDLYYFNPKKGIYEQDRSGRQINGIIRKFDDELKNGQVKETHNYIQDMSPVVSKLNENYIALKNGILNFNTFELEPFNSDIFILQKIGVNYNPVAYDSFVDSTLNKVTRGHAASIENIKEIFACVLYPGVLVPKIHYLLGRSAHNGKSSVLNLIHQTFNKDGGSISAVTPQKLASSTFAGSSIYGKLANIVDDNPESLIEDSGLLKTIVTGGYAEIERKGRDSETVRLSTTMIIASNHFPNLNESGNAINRRLNIIPFDHNFSLDVDCLPDEESMRLISSDSASEYVLKIAVDTLKRMMSNPSADKLTPNDKVREAATAFAEHNDPAADFFHEFNEQYFNDVRGTRAIKDYEDWCRENRVPPMDTKKFKEVVCTRYSMEWKDKSVQESGAWKTVKGFKSKGNK